ncbi:MAG TPA: response regulator transcription factor [Chromatiales bacterium]|nr:response regulator transcription factor [Chromatiales bacterium]
MKILIADDHAILRSGLRQILAERTDIEHIGEAANGKEVLQKMRAEHWDLLLLDLTMPEMSGLEVLKEIRQHWPAVKVLVLSMHAEDQYAIRVLKAGASGYMTKGCVVDDLLHAIDTVCSGEKYITLSVARKLASSFSSDSSLPPHERLSDREFQIFCMLVSGQRNAEIGRELNLSEKTVSTHRNRILEKMNMNNFAELVYYAVEHGFVNRPTQASNGHSL